MGYGEAAAPRREFPLIVSLAPAHLPPDSAKIRQYS
jgi:hypothetical protein